MPSLPILAVLITYGLILFAIGWWARRDSSSVGGSYVANKDLPSWVIAFRSNATGESAWLLLGLTGMGYAVGVHAFWVILGEVMGVALGWTIVALPFKAFADKYDAITVPDYLERRFRDRTHAFRWLGLLVIFTMVTAYTAAQLTATGKAFNAFVGTTYEAGVIIGAVIILYYTGVGGFKAVAYSDVLQGVLMLVGLAVLPVVGFLAVGGWTPVMDGLNAADPDLLRPMGSFGLTAVGIASAVGFVAIGFAFLGAPQLLTRWIAARDRKEIVHGGVIAVACVIVFDIGAIFAGMAGRVLFPGLADVETILPMMTTELFPALFTGIFLVIVLAASMSTVDSLLILVSSSVARDIVQKIFRPDLPERTVAMIGKLTTVVIGIGAVALAIREVRVIFWFVLFAWSGLASAFAPVVLCSLFWKRTTRVGAIAGMVAGFAAAIVWVLVFKEGFYDLYEMIPGFAVGFATTIIVSLMTEAPSQEIQNEFDEIHRSI